jgi:hypothetical protein
VLARVGLAATEWPILNGDWHAVKLFIFPSSTLRNIYLGIQAGMWAVAQTDPKRRRELTTKSRRMAEGSRGVFWSTEGHFFSAPFIVSSSPDPQREESNVWPGTWILPFRIHALGTLRKRLSKADSWLALEFLKSQPRTNITHVARLNALVSFVPNEVPEHDWEVLVTRLAD